MDIATLNMLTEQHMRGCKTYADYVQSMFGRTEAASLADVPYLPVRAFKEFELKSIADEDVFKVMRSSGTTGQPSRIYLDRDTAKAQTHALVDVFGDAFGKGRFPMLVIDSEATVKDRKSFSARTAAINGFSMFSRSRCFALDDDMRPNVDRVTDFLAEHRGKPLFVFGFTFLVWTALVEALQDAGQAIDLSDAFILHGGGWKKLEAQKVSNDLFKAALRETTGCTNVRNYYGMIEQTGTIFMECEHGRMHAATQADVLIRDPETHALLPHGSTGLIQVFSGIQKSYPGHSLMTEDLGQTHNGLDCPCGRAGTTVEVFGRLQQAEVRGCSDAYS